MTDIEINEVCENALELWGLPLQVNVAVEELSELIKELMKFNRDVGILQNKNQYEQLKRNIIGKHKDRIAEEIADVEIMLAQMKVGFEIDADTINDFKAQKLIRVQTWIDRDKK